MPDDHTAALELMPREDRRGEAGGSTMLGPGRGEGRVEPGPEAQVSALAPGSWGKARGHSLARGAQVLE